MPRDELSGKMHFKPSEYMPSKLHSALQSPRQPSPMVYLETRFNFTYKHNAVSGVRLGSRTWFILLMCPVLLQSSFHLGVHSDCVIKHWKHVTRFSSFLSGSWQLGNYRRAENRPNQCPETRQTWRLYAEEKKMAFKRLAQGTIFIVFVFRSSSS